MANSYQLLSLSDLGDTAERLKAELFQKVMTKRYASQGPHPLSAALRSHAFAAGQHFRGTNLVGIGFGTRKALGIS